MARITFKGLCSGTETRHSTKSNKDYQITKFVEIPSLQSFEVFGDLGLAAHEDVREYVIDASIVQLGNVKVQTAGGVAPAPAPKKS